MPKLVSRLSTGLAVLCAVVFQTAAAQGNPSEQSASLSLRAARDMAFAASAELVAAREVVAVAAGRARQAGAFINPVLSYSREQTSGGSPRRQEASQDIVSIDQSIDWRATRAARSNAARIRREAAEARVKALETQIAFDVARAYAAVAAADRRAALADDVARAFDQARIISEKRLSEGDVSGYSARRIRLEAARYATLRAEATLARRSARVALGALISPGSNSLAVLRSALSDSLTADPRLGTSDSLTAIALGHRADLKALELDAAAAAADAQLARRERTPIPTLTAGAKLERAPGIGSLAGFVAGVSVPLPLWDKRAGGIEAADAEARRRQAEIIAARRRIIKEVADAADAFNAVDEQVTILTPQIAADASTALRAAQTAYSEGEITLLDWLDAVRAYHETEASYAAMRVELFVRRAALAQAAGLSILEDLR